MQLTHLGSDPDSKQGNSARVFATDRGTFVVQGERITDADALATLRAHGLPDHEDAVEIPAAMVQFFPMRP